MCEVLPCDVHSSYPLGEEKMQQFDVVTCQLVLQGCCRTKEMYKAAALNLSRLVKPGGRLVILSTLEAEYYMVGNHKISVLTVDTTFLESVFEAIGFNNICFHICEGVFCHEIAIKASV